MLNIYRKINVLILLRCMALMVVLALTPQVHAQTIDQNNAKLLQAAADGSLTEVKALLRAGVDMEAKDKYGRTALMYAAAAGDV